MRLDYQAPYIPTTMESKDTCTTFGSGAIGTLLSRVSSIATETSTCMDDVSTDADADSNVMDPVSIPCESSCEVAESPISCARSVAREIKHNKKGDQSKVHDIANDKAVNLERRAEQEIEKGEVEQSYIEQVVQPLVHSRYAQYVGTLDRLRVDPVVNNLIKVRLTGNFLRPSRYISKDLSEARHNGWTMDKRVRLQIIEKSKKRACFSDNADSTNFAALPINDGNLRVCCVDYPKVRTSPLESESICAYCMGSILLDQQIRNSDVSVGSMTYAVHPACKESMDCGALFNRDGSKDYDDNIFPGDMYEYDGLTMPPCYLCGHTGGMLQYFLFRHYHCIRNMRRSGILAHIPCMRWFVKSNIIKSFVNLIDDKIMDVIKMTRTNSAKSTFDENYRIAKVENEPAFSNCVAWYYYEAGYYIPVYVYHRENSESRELKTERVTSSACSESSVHDSCDYDREDVRTIYMYPFDSTGEVKIRMTEVNKIKPFEENFDSCVAMFKLQVDNLLVQKDLEQIFFSSLRLAQSDAYALPEERMVGKQFNQADLDEKSVISKTPFDIIFSDSSWVCIVCGKATGLISRCPVSGCAIRAHPICAQLSGWEFCYARINHDMEGVITDSRLVFFCKYHRCKKHN